MRLIRCDSCGRPLSEGAVGRAEAVSRGGLMVCARCLGEESSGSRLPLVDFDGNRERFDEWYDSQPPASDTSDLDGGPDTDGLVADLDRVATDPGPERDDTDVIDPLQGARESKAVSVAGSSNRSAAPTRQSSVSTRLQLPTSRRARASTGLSSEQRGNNAPDSPGSANPYVAAQQLVHRRSQLLFPALALLVIVVPATAVLLWIAVHGYAERERTGRELELARAGVLKDRDELLRRIRTIEDRLYELSREAKAGAPPRSGIADNASAQESARPPTPPSDVESKSSTASSDPPPANRTVTTDPSMMLAALEQQEDQIAARILPLLGAATVGERILGLREVIHWQAQGAVVRVRELLASTHPSERQLAAEALGWLSDTTSLDRLRSLANGDPDPNCRESARRALAKLTLSFTQLELARLPTTELERLRDALANDETHALAHRRIAEEVRKREGRRE